MNAENTFDGKNEVSIKAFDGATLKDDVVSLKIPAKAIVVLELLK